MPYRIETTHADASSLGPSLQIEDEAQARAVAAGLRAGGLEVELFGRETPTDVWRRILLDETDPSGARIDRNHLLDEFIVIVRRRYTGDYELAAPTIFLTRSLAEQYAQAAHPDREALVVRGRFSSLKVE